jgi:hypothetical protein
LGVADLEIPVPHAAIFDQEPNRTAASGSHICQCYQESPRFVHPPLPCWPAQIGGNIEAAMDLKMPWGTSIVPI